MFATKCIIFSRIKYIKNIRTFSSKTSNCFPSVVSLYGAHRANVRKSSMAATIKAPVPRVCEENREVNTTKELMKPS